MTYPDLHFGSATIGSSDNFSTPSDVSTLLDRLLELGIRNIDTAARYPPTDMGASERLLGEASVASKGFIIDTKVLTTTDGSDLLRRVAVKTSVAESLQRLKVSKVRLFSSALDLYLHAS
jgi:aflatoxin B1 aldehyde reductase